MRSNRENYFLGIVYTCFTMPENKVFFAPYSSIKYECKYTPFNYQEGYYYYALTQTYNPNWYDFKQRVRAITRYVKKWLSFVPEYEMIYTVEYHKNGPIDDLLRPHVHAILKVKSKLSTCLKQFICKELFQTYGKSTMVMLETFEDYDAYYNYIQKDTQRLEDKTLLPHRFSIKVNLIQEDNSCESE